MSLRALWASAWFRLQLQVLLSLGLTRQALRCCEVRLLTVPCDPHALATQAQLQADDGDFASARDTLWRLLQSHPGQAAAWFNLGYLREGAGDAAGAETAFRRAVEIAPAMDRAWYGLAMSLIARQCWDEAESALHRTNALQPLSPFGWVQLARVLVRRQQPDLAREVIEHLQGFEPRVAAQLARETGLMPMTTSEGGVS